MKSILLYDEISYKIKSPKLFLSVSLVTGGLISFPQIKGYILVEYIHRFNFYAKSFRCNYTKRKKLTLKTFSVNHN